MTMTGAGRPQRGRARARHRHVVVVVHEVVREQPAGVRTGRAGASVRAHTVLRRRGVVVVLTVRADAGVVLVELGVPNDEMTAGVRPGVPERRVLGVGVVEHGVAVGAGTDVVVGVGHVAGVGVRDRARPGGVAHEDAVLGARRLRRLPERRRRRQVRAAEGRQIPRAGAVTAVPPDLVAAAAAAQEVARGEVLERDTVRFEDLDPVATRRALVGRQRSNTAPRRRVSRRSRHRCDRDHARGCSGVVIMTPASAITRLVIVARRNEHPVTRTRRVHRGLNGRVLATDAVPGPDAQHVHATGMRPTRRRGRRRVRARDNRQRNDSRDRNRKRRLAATHRGVAHDDHASFAPLTATRPS